MTWYRTVVECHSVPPEAGAEGAGRITASFAGRPWHRNAVRRWDGVRLILTLTAENDFDPRGRALMDEFSDEISACIRGGFDGGLVVVEITAIAAEGNGPR